MISDDRPDATGPDFVLTTKQLAEDLGISASLIHKLKSENPESLEGHWIKTDMNVLLWAESAKAVIEGIRSNQPLTENKGLFTGENATAEALTNSELQPPESAEPPTLDQFADDMAAAIAKDIVWAEVRRRIPIAITREIVRLLTLADTKAEFAGITAEWISPLQSAAIDSAVRIQMIEAGNGHHKALTGVSDEQN